MKLAGHHEQCVQLLAPCACVQVYHVMSWSSTAMSMHTCRDIQQAANSSVQCILSINLV
jgi:hypothetical protein